MKKNDAFDVTLHICPMNDFVAAWLGDDGLTFNSKIALNAGGWDGIAYADRTIFLSEKAISTMKRLGIELKKEEIGYSMSHNF